MAKYSDFGGTGISDMAFVTWFAMKWRGRLLPDVRELAALSVDPSGMPGDEFAKVLAADIARWTAVAKAANIRPTGSSTGVRAFRGPGRNLHARPPACWQAP
jgi:hypothetical protein